MKIDLASFLDLDPLADFGIFFLVIALLIAFALFLVVRYDLRRLRITQPDPFLYPIGEVPNLPPLPQGSIITAERSLAEAGTGYTARELYLIERSARRAAPAGQGSGGHGNSSCGPAAAGNSPPSSWRGRHAR